MKISINCPSYRRPKVKTLDYIPYCKVWVSESEYDEYIKENEKYKDNIIAVPDNVQGNVSRIRNYILDKELKDNDVVVLIDDDMSYIGRYEHKGLYGYMEHKLNADELLEFIEKYSILCDEFGFKFWGVNCNMDALSYRQVAPFSTTSVILGPFCCFLKENELRYDEKLPLKEDYDMAIQQLNKYRGILRLNAYHYNCKQSEQKGGCASIRNYEREKEQLELLQRKWGENIVKIDKAKNSNTKKKEKQLDYNPIIKVPIKGI